MLGLASCHPRGRAEPAPPRRGQAGGGEALRGKPWDNVGGGFLGGTRSACPQSTAGRKPGRNMIIGSKGTPGGLMETCLGQTRAILAGVQSPPLQGDNPRQDGLMGESPEVAPRLVLSEGRGLRARIARPYSCQGISLREVGGRVAVA
jgi:hypothetical protein